MVTARTWTVELPARLPLINANMRLHYHAKARRTKKLREAAWACARDARRPRIPTLSRARIVAEYQPPMAWRTGDAGNLAPTGKALIDGLRDAGILPDDNSKILVAEEYRIGPKHPGGRMVLHITEVLTEEATA